MSCDVQSLHCGETSALDHILRHCQGLGFFTHGAIKTKSSLIWWNNWETALHYIQEHLLSSNWDGQPFGHNRHGPKIGGCARFFFGGGAGSPSSTIWPGTRPTSVPSDTLMHLQCECRFEMYCTRLAEIQDTKNRQKIAISAPSHNFVGLYLRTYGMYRQSKKNY